MVKDWSKAQQMAREGNIELLAGQDVEGKAVQLRGELTDANCLLSKHEHAYDRAFCAKLCVAAGSPLLFVADDSELYSEIAAVKHPLFQLRWCPDQRV